MTGSVARGSQSVEESPLTWDFFANMPEEKEAFMRVAQGRQLSRKDVLFRQGEVTTAVFYIAKGEVMSSRISNSGKEVVLYIHRKGALLYAESTPLHLPSNTTEQAVTPCEVYVIQAHDYRSLAARFPRITERLVLQLFGSVDFLTSQYLSVFSDSAEVRLKKLLARLFSEVLITRKPGSQLDGVALNITQEQLACAIGISREMVIRVLRRLQAEGLIQRSAHGISVLKPDDFLEYLKIIPTYKYNRPDR